MLKKIREEAKDMASRIVGWRRAFHQNPELSFAELKTTKMICSILSEIGIEEFKVGVAGIETGVVADVRGSSGGGTIALRADIDALPIQEENDVDYKSRNPGVMHACGHDGHAAMLLGAAAVLQGHRDELSGRVRFIFQPSEEIANSGARRMIQEGVLDGVDAIAAIHLWQPFKRGVFAYVPGTTMAANDIFTITVRGKGGHGAYPHQTADPITAAAHIICQLQTIVSREINPTDSGVVTVGKIASGTACNIIPDSAEIEGTLRALSHEMRAHLRESIFRVAENSARACKCSAEVEIREGYPPTINSIPFVRRAAALAEQLAGPAGIRETKPSMGSEDMAYFLEKVPGCYMFLGVGDETSGFVHPHHSPRFDIDESVLDQGAAFLASLAWDFLRDGSAYE